MKNVITDIGIPGCYMMLNGNSMKPEFSLTLYSVLLKQ